MKKKKISKEAWDIFIRGMQEVGNHYMLEKSIIEYGECYRNDKDPLFLIRKLGEEFGELAEAMGQKDKDRILEEAADMGILLVAICGLYDASLTAKMFKKISILRKKAIKEVKNEIR